MRCTIWAWMCGLFLIGISISCAAQPAPATSRSGDDDADSWSKEVEGIRARLSLRRAEVVNGTPIIATYLSVQNVSDVSNPIKVAWPATKMKFRVMDGAGRALPMDIGAYDGFSVEVPDLVLPYDSTICFNISSHGLGISGNGAALLDFGPDQNWFVPRDGKEYFLEAVIDVPEVKEERDDRFRHWHGRIQIPRVRIPIADVPVDPAKLGSRIGALGTQMLGNDSRASEAAMRELSLIDDPRVVPWYAQAMNTDRYDLKYAALDRLSRFEGDAALAALRKGMNTQAADIGNCTSEDVAASSAVNIRLAAVYALQQSPHPQAKALLLSMANDPAASIRITVLQGAARMQTEASLELLKRMTRDPDADVRAEAARCLSLRVGEKPTSRP